MTRKGRNASQYRGAGHRAELLWKGEDSENVSIQTDLVLAEPVTPSFSSVMGNLLLVKLFVLR